MSADCRIAALAGWGHGAACWDGLPLASASLAGLSLPGHEPAAGDPAPDCSLAGAAATVAGDWDVVMGWSLGGLGALEAVRTGQIRPRGLVLLATPPSFLARPTYPAGLAAETLDDFRSGLADDPLGTLRRFYTLQFRGDHAPRSLWAPAPARARCLATTAEPEVLTAWLDVLAAADLTADPPDLDLPVLVLHGSEDAVVDPAAVAFFRGCGAQVSGHIIDGAGHAPHIAHPEETGKRIDEFVRALG